MTDDKGWKAYRNAFIMSTAQKVAARVMREYKNRTNWTVALTADDDLYYEVHEWLMAQEEDVPRRAVALKSRVTFDEDSNRTKKLQVTYDGDAANKVSIDGHEVIFYLNDPDDPVGNDRDISRVMKPPKLMFKAKSKNGRDAVISFIEALHDKKNSKDKKPSLWLLGKYSEWTRRNDLPARSMESVIVKGNIVDDLRADIVDFKAREEEYVRRGIPYHRAYLLTGPPGTGKTSSVKAVAQSLGMDLWTANLSEIERDGKLLDVLSDVRAGGILLLEDIDSFSVAVARETKKDGDKKKLTTSGLLNALDGVATPHGLITIMTTNHPDKLDDALTRPGRVDRTFEYENPDSATIHRHFEFFYGRPAKYQGEWPEGISSAAVSEIFKQHLDDSDGAEAELLTK